MCVSVRVCMCVCVCVVCSYMEWYKLKLCTCIALCHRTLKGYKQAYMKKGECLEILWPVQRYLFVHMCVCTCLCVSIYVNTVCTYMYFRIWKKDLAVWINVVNRQSIRNHTKPKTSVLLILKGMHIYVYTYVIFMYIHMQYLYICNTAYTY